MTTQPHPPTDASAAADAVATAKENTMKPMTYLELKAQIGTMTPEQLAAPVIWWSESGGGSFTRLHILEEDYINLGEGMEPASGYAEEPEVLEDANAMWKAGTPVLEWDE